MKNISLIIAVLTWTNIVIAGEKVVYEAETTISQLHGSDGIPCATMSAGAKTIVAFDDYGTPAIISLAITNGQGKEAVQGEYGIDPKGQPQNGGRLIFKPLRGTMPFTVIGPTEIYTYHLKYLELTTVKTDADGYRAYATKAIAFDNIAETASKTNIAYTIPDGGQLFITNGMIKFGNNYVIPNYELSGKVAKQP
jgi:hypothetical protein